MQTYDGLTGLRQLPPGVALTVGNFDGVHRGHRRLLSTARSLAGPAGVAVATFEPHPLTVLRPDHPPPPRLTPPPLKHALLAAAGVDHLVVLPPTPDVLGLSAEDFWQLLRDDVRPAHLVEGQSFVFGKARRGTVGRLREWSAGTGVRLTVVDPVQVPLLDLHVPRVSSSLVRWLLVTGRVRDAAICLSQPFALQGVVVRGYQRGRTIGVPTANLDCGDQLIPADGVYVARCAVDGTTYPAALSIGHLPTFADARFQVEAHLIGYAGDLYGRTLTVELIDWLREQWKFPGLDPLKRRIAVDLAHTAERYSLDAGRPIAAATA